MHVSKLLDDDVVISGLAIRLPEINTLEKFKSTLMEGLPLRPTLKEKVPSGYHGDFPAPGGRITGTDELDNIFFGMNNANFDGTDRIQMKGLETCFEALIDAGLNPNEVKDFAAQTYISVARSDGEYSDMIHPKTRYMMLGYCRAVGPNRVSFYFDTKGHSVSLDAGYSGGMQSMELASRDLKEGRTDLAIVSSGNLFVGEAITAMMDDLGWLSRDEKTSCFDNEADGYQRTEGYVALILQPAKHAKRIYARVKHVGCEFVQNHLTSAVKPSKESWINLLNKVYSDSGIPKTRIQYVETYGAAIKDWDASELNAMMEVFGKDRKTPLLVGSVKSNVGHTEGAADLVSIIKAIICLESGFVPANLNYKTPNRAVPGLICGKLKVADHNLALPDDALIAVNSYSFGNLYGHCILEGFKKAKIDAAVDLPRLIILSARVDDLFPQLFHQIEDEVPFDIDYVTLLHEVFKSDIAQHLGRGYTIIPKQEISLSQHQPLDGVKRPLWFVLSGMGSQWPGMGKDLMKLPLAQASLQKCHTILSATGLDLINIVTTEDTNVFKDILCSFVGIAAIQIALVDILNALNVVPDGIIGHSLGELVCAYADGSLNLEQAILASYYRGKAVKDATLRKGAMAAIGRGYSQLKEEVPANVEVACHNSNTSCTISGLEQAVLGYVEDLQRKGVFAKAVEVGEIGFHSQFIAPAGPCLLSYMQKIIKEPNFRSRKWISSSVPEADWNNEAALYSSAEYFTNNLLRPVLFEEACAHIPEDAILLEIAPHGLLQAILKRSFSNGINIPLTNRSAPDNFIFFLQAIGKLYLHGVNPDVASLYPKPDFPVAAKTNSLHRLFPWCPNKKPSALHHNTKRVMDLRNLLKKCDETLAEYVFWGQKAAPFSYYPYLIWNSYYQCDPKILNKSFCIKDLKIHKPFDLSLSQDLSVAGLTLLNSMLTEITKNEKLLASGYITTLENNVMTVNAVIRNEKIVLSLTKKEVYETLARNGYFIANDLQHLMSVDWTSSGLRGKMAYTNNWVMKLEALLHMAYLNITCQEEGLKTVSKIGKIEVVQIDGHEKEGTDLELLYDIATNEYSCLGLYVKDIFYKTHGDSSILSLHSTLPYINTPLKNIQDYVDFCGQIILQCKGMDNVPEVKILEVKQTMLPLLSPVIESTLKNVKVDYVSFGKRAMKKERFDLVICSDSQIQTYAADIDNFVLVRAAAGTEKAATPDDLTVVSSFFLNKEEKITLLKKKVVLNGEAQFIIIPEEDSDLIGSLKSRQKTKTNALLVGKSEPKEGILHFVNRIQSHTSMTLKWIFILDNSTPEFCTKNPLYQKQLEKGLRLNVLLNGSWNFIYKTRVENSGLQCNIRLPQTNSAPTRPKVNSLEGVKISCAGGELSWMVPPNWKVDNKDDIAAAYTMAYHCLISAADCRPYDSVLVTDAGSVTGQAAIAVALTRTNRIYATVGSPEEMSQLKAIFPKLNPDNVFLHSDRNFVVKLKDVTRENFPNIIYNTLDGRIAQDLFAFPPPYAKIFHLGKKDIEKNHTLCTSQFLKYVSLFAMSIDNIANWHTEEKLEVWQLVEEGLKNGVVQPLKAIKNTTATVSNRIHRVQRLATKCCRENGFEINVNGTYFILGHFPDVDVDIAEWLIRRGAKNIFMYSPSQIENGDAHKRKLNVLQLQKKGRVQVLDHSSVNNFLNSVQCHAITLEAMFYIHLIDQEPSPQVELISEILSSELSHFVAISRNRQFALKIQRRSNLNTPCTSIIWNKETDLIGRNMDALANLIGEHNLLSVHDVPYCASESLSSLASDLIPSTLESIRLLGAGLSNKLKLVEMTTLGPLMNCCSAECQPVFLFPGVEEDAVESTRALARGLLVPAFVVKIPTSENMTIMNVASSVITEISKVIDRKIYNLVGLSTGCVLAMEVARQLEKKGKVVSILMVDNPLHVLKRFANQSDMRSAILDAFTTITMPQNDKTSLDNMPWALQLNHMVSAMELQPLTESWIIKGVQHINAYFSAIFSYNANGLKLKGPLTVMRSNTFAEDDMHLNLICNNNYIMDIPLGHKNLLRSTELQSTINKSVILEDVSLKSVHEPLWVTFEEMLGRYRALVADEGCEAFW